MSDKISDSLIDEILNDLKAKNLKDDSEEIYSIDDIDSLLAEIGGTDLAVGSYSSAYVSASSEEKTEPAKNERVASTFTFDMSKVQDFDEFDDEDEETIEPVKEEVSVSVDDDGQLGFTSDVIDEILEDVKSYSDEEEVKPVTGQISIEKTRMFNEVDIRGAYNPNISHNLGNKVARATSGDAQPVYSSTMADEKYRKHFMNKPVQKLENTMEQRAIRMQRPQETIETPGLVVKSGSAEESTDGIRPVPTIVPAEYELEKSNNHTI